MSRYRRQDEVACFLSRGHTTKTKWKKPKSRARKGSMRPKKLTIKEKRIYWEEQDRLRQAKTAQPSSPLPNTTKSTTISATPSTTTATTPTPNTTTQPTTTPARSTPITNTSARDNHLATLKAKIQSKWRNRFRHKRHPPHQQSQPPTTTTPQQPRSTTQQQQLPQSPTTTTQLLPRPTTHLPPNPNYNDGLTTPPTSPCSTSPSTSMTTKLTTPPTDKQSKLKQKLAMRWRRRFRRDHQPQQQQHPIPTPNSTTITPHISAITMTPTSACNSPTTTTISPWSPRCTPYTAATATINLNPAAPPFSPSYLSTDTTLSPASSCITKVAPSTTPPPCYYHRPARTESIMKALFDSSGSLDPPSVLTPTPAHSLGSPDCIPHKHNNIFKHNLLNPVTRNQSVHSTHSTPSSTQSPLIMGHNTSQPFSLSPPTPQLSLSPICDPSDTLTYLNDTLIRNTHTYNTHPLAIMNDTYIIKYFE